MVLFYNRFIQVMYVHMALLYKTGTTFHAVGVILTEF